MFRKSVKLLFYFLITLFGVAMFQTYLFSKEYFETKSDVAIVLGAGTHNGKISPVFAERMNHAINLIQNKKVERIIVTGGFGKGQSISDSKSAKNYTVRLGIDSNDVLIEEESRYTFYNIKNSKALMDERDLKTALIVSDPYHMKRALQMCDKIGVKALPSPTPTTMYRTRSSKIPFFMSESFNYWLYLLIGQFR